MARPIKDGMDYFPHDTDAISDEKIEALRMLHGNDGYAFYFILLERIYRTNNGEIDISDAETRQILSRKIDITIQKFEEILKTCLKRNCFDRVEYENRGVLTSKGIKIRMLAVIEKRAKMRDSYGKLVSASETNQKIGRNSAESTQSKEEKSRVSKYSYDDKKIEDVLTGRLFNLIKLNNPNVKNPNFESWSKDIDRMLRIDNRSVKDIEKVIDWCQRDNFWKTNILSASKLREKFDQLLVKVNVANGFVNNNLNPDIEKEKPWMLNFVPEQEEL